MLEYFNNKLITVIDGKHTKEEILKIMVDLIGENSDALSNKEDFLENILNREKVGSTGIGLGIALPHARCENIKKIVVAVALLKEPINFNSLDGESVKLLVMLGACYFIFWEFILEKIKLPVELIDIGKNYFKLVGGLCVFQAITLTCGAVMKSHGNPKQMLFVNIGVNLLNIFGNGMFIFGWFGMPILGPTGVGISTVVSRAIGCVVGFLVMSHYCAFKFRKKFLKPFPFHVIKNILSIGIPTAGENLAWNIGQLMIMAMVNTMGTTMIASRTYLMLIANFVMTFSIALGHGTAIQVGQLVGAKETEEAYDKCFKSLKLSIVLAFGVTVVVWLLKNSIMGIFTSNEAILEASLKVFPLMIVLEVGRVFNIVIINSLHAAGDIKFPMFMGIIFIFIVAVPFSYIFGIKLGWGLVGIWIANAADEWCRGIAMLIRWKSKKWTTKSFVK